MNLRYISSTIAAAILLAVCISVPHSNAFAQETPLTLLHVMTALQSTSSGMNLSQKNSFITQRVNQRGVTFTLTEQLTVELKNAGASAALIEAIKANGPQSNQTSATNSGSKNADVEFSKLWVEQDVTRDGRPGMVVHTEFTAYNVNGVPIQLTVRFQDAGGATLKSSNQNFANTKGELSLFKNLNPRFDASVCKDCSVFVPYAEMNLNPGTHNLKIDANINYSDGKLLKHMILYDVTVNIAKPAANAPRAEFGKLWVEYGVSEGGLLGMRIHTKLKTYFLKGTPCWLTITFEKENGDRLVARNTLFADRTGGVTLSSQLTPAYSITSYNDISVFMPYEELNLSTGTYSLKMHADLNYPDGGQIQHLTYHQFDFTQP